MTASTRGRNNTTIISAKQPKGIRRSGGAPAVVGARGDLYGFSSSMCSILHRFLRPQDGLQVRRHRMAVQGVGGRPCPGRLSGQRPRTAIGCHGCIAEVVAVRLWLVACGALV